MAGLEGLLGLAASDVLRRRVVQAAALLPALGATPAIDEPGWAALIDAVTVQETRLFRHPAMLEALAAQVLPRLPNPARLLSAGCATGEEAYTLAMMAADAGVSAEVLGLDISRPALARAAEGHWPPGPPDPLRDVPPRFRPMLVGGGSGWQAPPALRGRVGFRRANLLAGPDWPADLILCRNVLIYLSPAARGRVVAGLAAALRPGGALVLGTTDSLPPGVDLQPWGQGLHSVWRRP
jgi:chemotaxis protein methyltransferase CheR